MAMELTLLSYLIPGIVVLSMELGGCELEEARVPGPDRGRLFMLFDPLLLDLIAKVFVFLGVLLERNGGLLSSLQQFCLGDFLVGFPMVRDF